MAFDFSSILGGLGGMFGADGSIANMLGMQQGVSPGVTGMQPPGMMQPGMGTAPQMPGMPGAGPLPGSGVQMPGAMVNGQMQQTGGQVQMPQELGPLAQALTLSDAQRQAMMQMAPMMQQQSTQPAQVGALPIAGMSGGRNNATRSGLNQGYMAAGGGIAPRRILRG